MKEELLILKNDYRNSGGTRTEPPQWAIDDKLYSACGYERGDYEEMGTF